jgi:putative Mg2+ transporter-C (MgtC) family protein
MQWITENWRSLLPHPWSPILLAVVAALCGAWVGVERQHKEKPAGVRTMALIALGSCAFTLIGFAFASNTGDSGRVAAQIVTGIGFLGGGVLLRGTTGIHGVTTAATVWLVAAMGMVVGAGYAGAGAGLAFLARAVLIFVDRLEYSRLGGALESTIRVVIDPDHGKTAVKLEHLLEEYAVPETAVKKAPAENSRELWVVHALLPRRVYRELILALVEQPQVCSVEPPA